LSAALANASEEADDAERVRFASGLMGRGRWVEDPVGVLEVVDEDEPGRLVGVFEKEPKARRGGSEMGEGRGSVAFPGEVVMLAWAAVSWAAAVTPALAFEMDTKKDRGGRKMYSLLDQWVVVACAVSRPNHVTQPTFASVDFPRRRGWSKG
jgi:hypothetical protein